MVQFWSLKSPHIFFALSDLNFVCAYIMNFVLKCKLGCKLLLMVTFISMLIFYLTLVMILILISEKSHSMIFN